MLAINIIVGTYLSSITSIRLVHVIGVKAFDKSRITKVLETVRGIPCIRVNARNVEALILDLPEVQRAELTRNPFGSARLNVTYRVPVARRFGKEPVAFSADGMMFRANELPPNLPEIRFADDSPGVSLGMGSNCLPVSLLELATRAARLKSEAEVIVDVNLDGTVCLNIGKCRLLIGTYADAAKLDQQFEIVQKLLAKDPTIFDTERKFNLISPTDPVEVTLPAPQATQKP